MATISPPGNFWPLTTVGLGGGIQFATAPLFIAGNTISAGSASDITPGVVTTADQPYSGIKDFTDGIKIATGQTITAISTDATMAGANDTTLATQKAVKDYVDTTGGVVDSVVNPLYLVGASLRIYDAGAAQAGVVSTGVQTLAGAKTLSATATLSNGAVLTPIAANPGTLDTLWFDTNGLTRRGNGSIPKFTIPPVPVSGQVVTMDPSVNGDIVPTPVTIDSTGVVAGVTSLTTTNIQTDALTISGTFTSGGIATFGGGFRSGNGLYFGKQIYGGRWYKVYVISAGTNDSLGVWVHTKDVDSELPSSKTLTCGTCAGTALITFAYSLDSGLPANQPRIIAFQSATFPPSREIYQNSYSSSSSITTGNHLLQSFTAVTGKRLYSIKYMSKTGGTAGLAEGRLCAYPYVKDDPSIAVSTKISIVSDTYVEFVFPTTPLLVSGTTYTFAVVHDDVASVIPFYRAGNLYAGGSYGWCSRATGATTWYASYDLAFEVWTFAPGAAAVDIYAYCQPEPLSKTDFKILGAGTDPVWTDEGDGVWPTGHPAGADIVFDTDDPVTYPPNLQRSIGPLKAYNGLTGISSTGPQLQVAYEHALTNTANFTVDASGVLTVGASGLNTCFAATDAVHVLGTEVATGTTTGALTVAGGLGVATKVYAQQLVAEAISSQLTVISSVTGLSGTLEEAASGELILTTAPTKEVRTAVGNPCRICNTTASTSKTTGALLVDGGLGVAGSIYADNFGLGTVRYRELDLLSGASTLSGSNEPSHASAPGGQFVNWMFEAPSTRTLYLPVFHAPEDMVANSPLRVRIHWHGGTNATGNVRLSLLAQPIVLDDTVNNIAAATTLMTVTVPSPYDDYTVSAFADIATTGIGLSTIYRMAFSRLGADVLDTYAGDFCLLAITCSYQVATLGRSTQ